MSSRKPSRGWLGSALAIGTAVAAGAAIYHYAASWTRAAAVETPGDASSGDAETTATAPARAARPTKRDKQAAAASRAQAELLGALDDARDDDDDDEDERVVGTLGDRSPSFSAAAARAKTLARVSNENKLRLYALYKHATAGPCASPKPRLVDADRARQVDGGSRPRRDALPDPLRPAVRQRRGTERRRRAPKGTAPKRRPGRISTSRISTARVTPSGSAARCSAARRCPGTRGSSIVPERRRPTIKASKAVRRAVSTRVSRRSAEACRGGDAARVRDALARPGVDANAADEEGRTELHWAADGGHEDAAAALLAAGAAADARTRRGRRRCTTRRRLRRRGCARCCSRRGRTRRRRTARGPARRRWGRSSSRNERGGEVRRGERRAVSGDAGGRNVFWKCFEALSEHSRRSHQSTPVDVKLFPEPRRFGAESAGREDPPAIAFRASVRSIETPNPFSRSAVARAEGDVGGRAAGEDTRPRRSARSPPPPTRGFRSRLRAVGCSRTPGARARSPRASAADSPPRPDRRPAGAVSTASSATSDAR